jgi:hypothetical protein
MWRHVNSSVQLLDVDKKQNVSEDSKHIPSFLHGGR